ncbi:MAG: NAD(P)H-hydrate epimerase, partial [Prevotella sp.]|nr:NAD(P)H-hydrate epimerase [Prevotella sp.]
MKIFTSAQIRELDHYTIEHEPIKSIDLMERAAEALTKAITELWDTETPFIVFAGPGNNGGDALAVTRKLINRGYNAKAYLFNVKGTLSPDCIINKERLREMGNEALVEITREFEPPTLTRETVVIDGLFGSGINKPLGGGFAAMVNYINQSESKVVSIDIPSGLMTEDNSFNVQQNIIRADLTLTLGMKKLCMMMADNKKFIGKLEVLDIGLSKEFIDKTEAQCSILEEQTIRSMMKERSDYAHKGSMGHALLIAGSYGMVGAAILASKACLRSGAGKLTVHTPS